MTPSGATVIELYKLALQRHLKTAYAVSFRYASSILHARQLVAAGAIGEPLEVECISHFNLEREIRFQRTSTTLRSGGVKAILNSSTLCWHNWKASLPRTRFRYFSSTVGLVPRFHEDHIVFHGMEGPIYIKCHYGSVQLYLQGKSREWEELLVPQEITTAMPVVDGKREQCWHYLARAFVKDIGGEAVERYPAFKERSRYRQLIDLIRRNDN